jgi:hypothetical protein
MKKLSFFTLFFLAYATANVSGEQAQTLFGGKDLSHGGFGAPEIKISDVDGHSRLFTGAKAAWIVDHGFYLGVGGYGMTWGIDAPPDEYGDKQYLHMGYGGVLMGYTFFSNWLVHANIEHIIGAGGYGLVNNAFGDENFERHMDRNNANAFFVWDPQVTMELNVAKYFRVTAGVGYRALAIPREKHGFSSQDLSGITGSLSFKAGKF